MQPVVISFISLIWLSVTPSTVLAQNESGNKSKDVIIKIIDKVAAKPVDITVPLETVVKTGTLEILATRCWTGETKRYAALLEIYENTAAAGRERLFAGWMFSHNPSITSLEHPYYDISIVKCIHKKKQPSQQKKEQS